MMKYILILLVVFAGCIQVPIEPIEEKLDGVEERSKIEEIELKDCLRECGVPEHRIVNTSFDRTIYRNYTLGEMKSILNSQEWIRQLKYNMYDRNCTDFAIMFLAVCKGLMPSAPVGTIEYNAAYEPPLKGYQLYGHKVVLFFYKNYRDELICVLVDPRNKKISRLDEVDILIREIDM